MEHIREALTKAKVTLDNAPHEVRKDGGALDNNSPKLFPEQGISAQPSSSWTPRLVELDPRHMERNRIVSFAPKDSYHVSFNLLRTRIRKILNDSRWKTIGLTSPSPGCGKTMVSVNLAFSLARSPELNIVLIDLDLKKPTISKVLGVEPTDSIGNFLRGKAKAEDCFVRVAPNLTFGLNSVRLIDSSELIQSQQMTLLRRFIDSKLAPDVILFDLPPMGSSDDALAILPQIDTALLIVAAGKTTVKEVDTCETQLSEAKKFLGVVMNKSKTDKSEEYYY